MRWLLVCALLASCNRPRGAPDAAPAAPAPEPKGLAGELDPRQPMDLVRDLKEAQGLPVAQQDARYEEIARRWSGRRYRWQGQLTPRLCQSPQACWVMVLGPEARMGWLPRVAVDAEAHRRLRDGCQAELCDVTVEGTLTLQGSSVDPILVTFGAPAVTLR